MHFIVLNDRTFIVLNVRTCSASVCLPKITSPDHKYHIRSTSLLQIVQSYRVWGDIKQSWLVRAIIRPAIVSSIPMFMLCYAIWMFCFWGFIYAMKCNSYDTPLAEKFKRFLNDYNGMLRHLEQYPSLYMTLPHISMYITNKDRKNLQYIFW